MGVIAGRPGSTARGCGGRGRVPVLRCTSPREPRDRRAWGCAQEWQPHDQGHLGTGIWMGAWEAAECRMHMEGPS